MASLEATVCRTFDVHQQSLRTRGTHGNLPRAAAIYLAKALTLGGLEQLGQHFGGVRASAVSNVVRAIAERRAQDVRLDAELASIENALTKNE